MADSRKRKTSMTMKDKIKESFVLSTMSSVAKFEKATKDLEAAMAALETAMKTVVDNNSGDLEALDSLSEIMVCSNARSTLADQFTTTATTVAGITEFLNEYNRVVEQEKTKVATPPSPPTPDRRPVVPTQDAPKKKMPRR